ncbi:MAG: asparagine synthase (glutamine-hydrolyzing), partial [Chloroflexota bacterium]
MCGICGKLNLDYQTPVIREDLQEMANAIRHRGPDGEGLYLQGSVGLGHRRLSIIDLSTGDQPISNEDGTVWVVFNGEIYNYIELRAELQSKGHHFTTESDTEVIVHAYEEWGPESCAHLRGMFAYGLWDEVNQRLVLARDRLGQKPLLYTTSKDGFYFSSEFYALLQASNIAREVNLSAINAYLTRLYVPTPQTAFCNIYKLPPAHYATVENGAVKLTRYWHLDFSQKFTYSENELCEQLWELLRQTVQMRLMSDVPLGAFLSGGLDSSAVVGIMSQLVDEPIKTFSIGYKESGYDESRYARQVADLFNTDHYEFTVNPNALELLPKLILHYGEPFADASSLPTYYVSQLTRQYVTVALSGDGGDESFAGYERYQTAQMLDLYRYLPLQIRQRLIPFVLDGVSQIPSMKNLGHQLQIVAQRGMLQPETAYLYRHSVFTPDLAFALWQDDKMSSLTREDAAKDIILSLSEYNGHNSLDRWLYLDLKHYLTDDILVKVDIASMINSLEVRSPFLDHKLIEFAAALPPNLKRRRLETKYILKKTLERLLPHNIIYRSKHGFQVPIDQWFQAELKEVVREILLDRTTLSRGYFRPDKIE